ncbi:Mur ligase family protein [Aminiphilus sp.]|uniref:Mur ligase family protein n=1 Tax=Aminiphilus sp. TaxID=1872488 RepID=UPI00262684BF|nr:Mur ligase family protein [Aminiphilus sp.]
MSGFACCRGGSFSQECVRGLPVVRILVTGTRGKSGTVRLLAAALAAQGYAVWARITGVTPLSLEPAGTKAIRRAAGAHVEEMRWWLGHVAREVSRYRETDSSAGKEAVVLENSAVAPELQHLAGCWMDPTLVVWTNARADHEEVWGPGTERAFRVLLGGVPPHVPVACGGELAADAARIGAMKARGCAPFGLSDADGVPSFREICSGGNPWPDSTAVLAACIRLGLDLELSRRAWEALPPSVGEFRVLSLPGCSGGDVALASAFAANDPESTRFLWEKLGWLPEETTLWYHHRMDRPARYRAFLPWMYSLPWKARWITGPAPFRSSRFLRLGTPSPEEMTCRLSGRVFGCGNIAGLPLELLLRIG